jgi:predicted GH43/DUF377 family glycosyl hydrolase
MNSYRSAILRPEKWGAGTPPARGLEARPTTSGLRRVVNIVAAFCCAFAGSNVGLAAEAMRPAVLDPGGFKHYVDSFNANDRETIRQHIPDARAWEFLKDNVPLFECPDKDLEEIYYFRWWTYRKHIRRTPDGFIVTEFLPAVSWAGKHNSISCAAGHHLYEGRWIHARKFLDDYSVFWFRKGGKPRVYSCWLADAIYNRYLVTGHASPMIDLLRDLVSNFEAWEKDRRDAGGLFWQEDGQDGMEVSIGGSGYRPTINSYMYGDAVAIAAIAELGGRKDLADRFRKEAARIKRIVDEKLWDEQARFYKVLPRGENARRVDVRELHGYTPWYFNLPDPGREIAWKQILDPQGFHAPFGPTTAERRHPRFLFASAHDCCWNGPSWPYATAVTLVAMANVLNNYRQEVISRKDYLETFRIYARTHRLKRDDGTVVPWIDEDAHPDTGLWLARDHHIRHGDLSERGRDYNHSTFCDLVITGLVGLRPRADEAVEVNPLVPEGTWDHFCLDNVLYHGHILTILYDRTGSRYGKGAGFRVLADGKQISASANLARLVGGLPSATTSSAPAGSADAVQTTAGWVKYPGNPVLGGRLGTCFDVSVLKEDGTYRMWFSWRPKASIAMVESTDGVHWGQPLIAIRPNPQTDWEADINRPVVLKHDRTYHMWYTGQTRDHSRIGYATSPDGKTWKRMSNKPVLSPTASWEKTSVMCPHVIWDGPARLFRMWYSGGEQYEPDAIGCATSPDGLVWTARDGNPIFRADPKTQWERHKVTACQVIPQGDGYLMFYIGFADENRAQIGVARSKDGITGWQRHPANPIIRPGPGQWDHDACYKPYAIFDGRRWLLWYNGRRDNIEQIGVATHEGQDLGF